MFESFKTVCYFPLIVFAMGWGISQTTFSVWIRKNRNISDSKIVDNTQKSIVNILFYGMIMVSILLIGLYARSYVRWFILGGYLIFTMFMIAKIGATTEFTIKKIPQSQQGIMKIIMIPQIILLTCCIVSGVWLIYIFAIAGL